jgi:hypothetical protein
VYLTEKAAMVTEQTSPRVAKEPPSYLFGQAPAGIQMTEFEESHWNDTDWTGVFGRAQAEPILPFPRVKLPRATNPAVTMRTKAENESVFGFPGGFCH